MIITKRSLSRRILLRGLGTTLALPLLDAMVPPFTVLAKTAGKPIHRFQAVYAPNGMAMEYWTPAGEGSNFEFTPILQPLTPFRNQVLVLSGLRASWPTGHNGATTSFLTGTAVGGRNETEIFASTSIDQVLAKEWGKATQVASLELSLDKKGNAGQCSGGLNCAYTNTITWRTPTMPLPMESSPGAVFERLFGDGGSTDSAARRARMRWNKSILDSVVEKLADLKRQVGPQDTAKLDEYVDAIRDVERRIHKAEEQSDVELPLMEQPAGAPQVFEEYAKLMFDLQLLALQCDLTRVVTFMIGREQSGRTYSQLGVPDAHHPLSHHQNDPARIAQMAKINAHHVKLFADYLTKLRATADGDGSLLDHMTIMYGSGISNSTLHSPDNLPLLVVGGGAGRLRGGRHLKYPSEPSVANLLVTLMDKLDMPLDRLGNSTGALQLDTLSGV